MKKFLSVILAITIVMGSTTSLTYATNVDNQTLQTNEGNLSEQVR